MYLTLSKRFEFSASRRMSLKDRNIGQNLAAYGPLAEAEHGIGDNFIVYLVFTGKVDKKTGMMLPVSEIKEKFGAWLDERYDHKNLSLDNPAFEDCVPSVELMSRMLLNEAQEIFKDSDAKPVVVHLDESPFSGATAYDDGRVERHLWLEFSAARRTFSPRLTDIENRRLFGIASNPAGHGHNYRLRVTISGNLHPTYGTIVPYTQLAKAAPIIRKRLDHRHINKEVMDLKGLPITSETIARYSFERLSKVLPVDRVRLYELPHFFVEYLGQNQGALGMVQSFRAAHRLNNPKLSEKKNLELYGKCNNPNGHGHRYDVEASIHGRIDEETGIIFDFIAMQEGMEEALSAYDSKFLDLETDDFTETPSTCEHILAGLWPRMHAGLRRKLSRLRMWETPNNRFTLRKDEPAQ